MIEDNAQWTCGELAGELYNQLMKSGLLVNTVKYYPEGGWSILIRGRWGLLSGNVIVAFDISNGMTIVSQKLARKSPVASWPTKEVYTVGDVQEVLQAISDSLQHKADTG